MTDEEFKGVGHVYVRPGQWFALNSVGVERATRVSAVVNDDGTITVSSTDKYGAVKSRVGFGPDGKVKVIERD